MHIIRATRYGYYGSIAKTLWLASFELFELVVKDNAVFPVSSQTPALLIKYLLADKVKMYS